MDNNLDSRKLRKIRMRNWALSIIVCVICGVALLLPQHLAVREAYNFEVAVDFDISEERNSFEETGDNEALYRLMLALCREAYLTGETFDATELCDYGRELYRRAKAGEIDLEKIGEIEATTAMLALLKDYGVTAVDS